MDPQNQNPTPMQDPMVIQPAAAQPQPQPVAASPTDTMFQPRVPQGPPGTVMAPVGQPAAPDPTQVSAPAPAPSKRSKKPFIIIAVVVALFAGITLAVLLTSSNKPKAPQEQQATDQQQGPQPAQAIDVEQTSNSISQDISGHDNNKDFPTTQLEDKDLGL